MTRRRAGTRSQACGEAEANAKLRRAATFLEVVESIIDEDKPDPDFVSAAAAIVVLAGICASDAACCKALGQRSRSDNHHDAESLLKLIMPGGADAANSLRRLINIKDEAHYGFHSISNTKLVSSIRQARKLVAFAEQTLRR